MEQRWMINKGTKKQVINLHIYLQKTAYAAFFKNVQL